MAILHYLAETFVTNTSMRGFLKLYRTQHSTLRIVWTLYLLSMACLLAIASYYLVDHYTSYFVTVQQSELVQDATPMPAVAVCSERPMGDSAVELWRNGAVLSPLRLHSSIRRSMRQAFEESRQSGSRSKFYAAKDLFYADKISTYFQNVHINHAKQLGVQADDLILFCLMKHSKNRNPSVSHDEICKMSIKWIRHPQYMNCYDVTIDPEVSRDVSSVSLILRSGWRPSTESEAAEAHVFDLFTQSQGVRIALHDAGSHPDVDENGVSVGLGRNTRIRYSLEHYRRLNLNKSDKRCLNDAVVRAKSKLRDFGQEFTYTFGACMSSELGRLILKQCGCVSTDHLVGSVDVSRHNFCHFHNFSRSALLANRLDCIRNVKLPKEITELRRNTCLHRCEFNKYRVQISSSEWLPTQWQLKLILGLSPQWDVATSKVEDETVRRTARQRLMDYLALSSPLHETVNHSDFDLNRLTLVTVQRSSYNTEYRTETLQINLSTLMAQIGGLGSLTVGITLTFLFEIIEFVFLAFRLAWKRGERGDRKMQEVPLNEPKQDECGVKRENDE